MSAPRLFDRELYRLRRARAARRGADAVLLAEAAAGIADRAGAATRAFTHGLELGARMHSAAHFAPLAARWTKLSLSAAEGGDAVGDEELLPFAPESFDLVVSPLGLQTVNDLPGALIQIRRVLKPDGLFVGALFAGDTLSALRAAFAEAELALRGGVSPRVHPFADVRSLGGLLQRAGFALPVADSEETRVEYRRIATLFDDLRGLGESNCLTDRDRTPLSRSLLGALAAQYGGRFATAEGRLPAVFEIVYLTGWAPHESQPQPLKPGSAEMRLADALGAGTTKT